MIGNFHATLKFNRFIYNYLPVLPDHWFKTTFFGHMLGKKLSDLIFGARRPNDFMNWFLKKPDHGSWTIEKATFHGPTSWSMV